MAAIFETEIFDLAPTAYGKTRGKAKKQAKGKGASALKTYKKKVQMYYALRHKWTAGAKRAELERIAAFCKAERIDLAEQRDGIAILLKLYRTAEQSRPKEAAPA